MAFFSPSHLAQSQSSARAICSGPAPDSPSLVRDLHCRFGSPGMIGSNGAASPTSLLTHRVSIGFGSGLRQRHGALLQSFHLLIGTPCFPPSMPLHLGTLGSSIFRTSSANRCPMMPTCSSCKLSLGRDLNLFLRHRHPLHLLLCLLGAGVALASSCLKDWQRLFAALRAPFDLCRLQILRSTDLGA